MSQRDITWLVEEYGQQLLRTHSALKHIPMRHKDDRQKPQPTCITLSAEVGSVRMELAGASEVELKVNYRSDKATPQQNSLIADAIDECFSERYAANLDTPEVLSEFSSFWIEDQDKSSDRTETKSLRKFSFTIPIVAKLK